LALWGKLVDSPSAVPQGPLLVVILAAFSVALQGK
jgi:hypothetical protein